MNQNYNFVRGLLTLVSNARNEEFATKKGTSFKSLLLLVVFALFAGISMQGQTYFTESFEGAWYLNGNSSTVANATGPNAPSGWTQTRVLNDVVSAGSAAGGHDWAQSVSIARRLSPGSHCLPLTISLFAEFLAACQAARHVTPPLPSCCGITASPGSLRGSTTSKSRLPSLSQLNTMSGEKRDWYRG